MNKLLRSKKPGAVLALMMLIVVVLSIVGMGLLNLGLHSRLLATRNNSEITAKCAADAGLTKALFEMNKKLKTKPWDGSSLPQATDETLPNSDATFSYKVTTNVSGGYTVESTGKSHQTAKKVSSVLSPQGLFEYAIFAKDTMDLKNGVAVKPYNCDAEGDTLKIGTGSIGKDKIILNTDATVYGDVVIGPGGDPDVVIDLKSGADITGDSYAATETQQLPAITVPADLQAMKSEGDLKKPGIINKSGKYNKIELDNSEVLKIDGPVSLYITGDVRLKNLAQLQIDNSNPDASLTLFLGGQLIADNGGNINNLTKDAKKLKVYGLDTCDKIEYKTAGNFYGAVYAPEADALTHNSVNIFGSIIAKKFTLNVGATLNYDCSLKETKIDDEGLHFVVKRWSEE